MSMIQRLLSFGISTSLLLSVVSCKDEGFDAAFGGGTTSGDRTCSPTITAVVPSVVPPTGAPITINGVCFKTGMQVYIGGNLASGTVQSLNQFTGTAPSSTLYGPVTVVVVNADEGASSLPAGLSYQGPPQVSSLTPAAGPLTGGSNITVLGAGFLAGATIKFGGASSPIPLSVINSAQASVVAPAGSAGLVDVTVTNGDGQSGTLPSAYRFQAAPAIAGISPANGPGSGGTSITVYGSGFLSNATVLLGGAACGTVAVAGNGLQLTCATPPMVPGPVDVKVQNTDGQSSTLVNGFTFTGTAPAPNILSVSPNAGTTTGGQAVTITGTGFQNGATVSFGGTPATIATTSATSISVVTLPRAAGVVAVTVTNPDTQSSTLGSAFTYNNPPILSSVSPSGGPLAGGNSVTLTGSNFAPGATVTIGAGSCAPVLVNPTTATCPAPAGSAGAKTVVITNPDGTSSSLSNSYTYNVAPTISSLAPQSGKLASGTMVTLTGTGFISGLTVTVGGAAASVLATSSNSLFLSMPSGSAGAKDVIVTNPDGQTASLVGGYTFQAAPNVASISPTSGALGGGTSVTISGSGFLSGASVSIGTAPLSGISVVNSSTITGFTTASSAGAKTITITNTDSQVGTLSNGFTYASGPTATSSSPTAGALAGNTLVTVTGTNFTSPMTVTVNGISGTSVNVVSSTSVTFRTPANTAGTYSIVLTDNFGQSTTLSNAFTYEAAPNITTVSPNAGPLAGGTNVTITGTGFNAAASVSIGGVSLTGLTIGSTTITGQTGANVVGTYSAAVNNPDGQSGIGGSFSYRSAPTVTSISPTSGTTAGGTSVTITGTGFVSGITASVGGVACTSPTFVSATSMTCTSGFHPAGAVDVVVTNTPDLQTGTGTGLFTYSSPPVVVSISPSIGFIGGENQVSISGTGFAAGATVNIGTRSCSSVSVVSASSITCSTPAGVSAATVNVVVTNPDTQVGTLTNGFQYKNDNYTTVDQYLGNASPNGYLDGTGSAVRFNQPTGIAVDSSGNVYVAENTNCTIRLITPSGVVATFAGTPTSCALTDGPGTGARFRNPQHLEMDPSGTALWVAEWGAIRRVSLVSPYNVTTLAGSGSAQAGTDGTGAAARFNTPESLAIDPTGTTLYVADTGNHTIRAITISTGVVTTIAGAAGVTGSADNTTGTSARFNRPWGMTWTTGGILYINDLSNQVIRRLAIGGTNPVTTVVGTAGAAAGTDGTGSAARMYNPTGMVWDGASALYIGDGNNSTVRSANLSTFAITTLYGSYNSQGSSDDVYNSARFNLPHHLAYDSTYIYVSDYNNHIVRRIRQSTGEVETLAGVANSYGYTDGTQSVAKFWTPRGMSAVGANLYISEWSNCLLRRTDTSNVTTYTFAGQAATCSALDGVGTFSARLHRTAGMATDGTNLFLADTGAHVIRRVTTSSGSINTIAGLAANSGNATGTGNVARFNAPYGIAVVGTDIYVADTSNHVIRKVQSTNSATNAAVVTTFAGTPVTAGWQDGAAGSAKFNNPYGITALGANLYVADYSNCVIRQIVIATGVVSTIAGTQGSCSFADGTGNLSRFNNPFGMSNDGTNLYVTDYSSNAVRKIALPLAQVTTLFGDPTSAFDTAGGPIGTVNMRNPTGIFWSAFGLFIANDYGVKRAH